jgi:uncharacterized protein YlxP (DUF503 family)
MTGTMVSVPMSEEERELVHEILEERHRTFLVEISHTDHHDFKVELQRKAKLLESVLGRLMAHA